MIHLYLYNKSKFFGVKLRGKLHFERDNALRAKNFLYFKTKLILETMQNLFLCILEIKDVLVANRRKIE